MATSLEEWQAKMNAVPVSKEDLNRLVMNYLVIEGYKEAAEKFAQESGESPRCNLDTFQNRMRIRAAVQRGDVTAAIEMVNDVNPEILDTNPGLFFHLQQQRLIELIRENKIEEALEFAQEHLAARGEENPAYLADLEKTMALFAYDPNSMEGTPVAHLLQPSQRQKTASELNAAILESQCQEQTPKLPQLLKLLVWAQTALEQKETKVPIIRNLATAEFETSRAPGAASE